MKKKTKDVKAAEKYARKASPFIPHHPVAASDFLEGVRYGRRTAIEAVKQVKKRQAGSHTLAMMMDAAIDAIRGRNRQ